jgi:uncharacterized protein
MPDIIDIYCTLGTERETRLGENELLRLMDRAKIDRAVVAPEDREMAVDNAAGNRRIAAAASRHQDRLIPACTINPWTAEAGCEELCRAAAAGARMLVLSPAVQGFWAGDEVSDALLDAAGRRGLLVYIHTGPHSAAAPSHVVLLAARHPRTSFVLGHCGSTDYLGDMRAVFQCASENLWYDLSLVRPFLAAHLPSMVSPSRLMFGSSAPRNDPALELHYLAGYLPVDEYPEIYGGNMAGLLAKRG